LILLDEPTSGLDPLGSRDMKDLILKLKAQGKTIVMCSHLLADVQDVCDRIAILYQGELKVLDRVDDLLRDRDVTQLRAPRLPPEALKAIEPTAARHGAQIHEIGQPPNTLEELSLTVIRESAERPGQRFVNTSAS